MYVNPRTGFIIQIGLRTYRELSKNPAWKKKLAQSPKSSSKAKLKKKCKKMIAHSKQQSPQAQLKTPDEKIDEENDNWIAFSQLNEIQLKDESKIWIESLSQEEREAVGWYVDSSVFINAAFRLGGENLECAKEFAWDMWSENYYHENIRSHDTAFRTLREMSRQHRFLQMSFPIKLYRAVKDYDKYCKFMVEVCIDLAPLSTSVKWKGANLREAGATLVVIHVPPETPLIPVYLIEGDETQKEVLLGPGTKLKLRKNLGNFTLPHYKTSQPLNNVNVIEMDVVK